MSSNEEEDSSHHNDNDESSTAAAGVVDAPPDEDTIRILVSTDNHLGFAENDSVRGNDSFAAMEEVLFLAKHHRADMVLLAGDLFHHNKPSRRTLIKTMDLFRRYCLGPDPVNIQILSNQVANFRRGLVNYEDENYSVDMPVFSIHGNHDDPTREGGTELFAALDLLDTANLVNYVGRQDQVDKIEVSPILIQKGDTHLALYGLGSMRDERLNRMWRAKKVSFLRPSSDKQWFNLFALHQNRDLGRGTKNCVHESMIPEWMDLVVWGHEHECCITPHESVVGTFRITQPGSSVATSLTGGEAERKQIGILDIRQQSFRLLPIPLTQVRTFVLGEVSLAAHGRLNPEDPKVELKMTKVLEDQVRVLIHNAKEKRQELQEAARKAGNAVATSETSPLTMELQKPDEVLVRVKVEHSSFSTLNNQRFGAKFMGQVANPTDILLFHRKKKTTTNTSNNNTSNDKLKHAQPMPPGDMGDMNIEDLIIGELENSDKNLELFSEKRITSALESYVQKQLAQAIPDAVNTLLDKQQRRLIKGVPQADENEQDDDDDDAMSEDMQDGEEEENEPPPATNNRKGQKRKTPAPKASPPKRRGRAAPPPIADDEDDDFVDSDPPPPKKSRATPSRSYAEDSDEEEESPPPKPAASKSATAKRRKRVATYEDSDDDDDVVEVVPAPTRKRQTKKAAAATTKTSKSSRNSTKSLNSSTASSRLSQSQLSFTPRPKRSTSKKAQKYADDSDDEDYQLDDDWGGAKTDTHEL